MTTPSIFETLATPEQVRVTAPTPPAAMTQAEWVAWVQRMAGAWEGKLERPPQDDYEVREPLS